jgi:hypothetical protein
MAVQGRVLPVMFMRMLVFVINGTIRGQGDMKLFRMVVVRNQVVPQKYGKTQR